MNCPNCGFENPGGFSFCGQCGARLATAPAQAPDDRQATIRQLKQAGDNARHSANASAALEHYQQALALLDSAIGASDATLQVQLLKQRFDILAERWRLWAAAGQTEHVEPDLQDMLALARRSGDGARLSGSITALARLYVDQRRYEAAGPLLEEAVSLLHTQGDRPGEAAALAEVARLKWRAGEFDHVAEAFQRAHELRRSVADPSGLARSYFDLGILYRDGLSHAIHAVAHFDRSIEFARHGSDTVLETRARIELSRSWTRLGDFARSASVLDEAEAQAGEAAVWVRWLIARAEMLRDSGSPGAAEAAERTMAVASEVQQSDLEWDALLARATIQHASGEWQAALGPIERMQQLERSGGLHAYCAIWSSMLLARSCLHTSQLEAALPTSTRAAQALYDHGSWGVPVPQAILWTHFEVLSAANDPSALNTLRQAREAMLAQASTIGEGALRARFLRDVPVNRCIADDWARQHA